MSYLGLSNQYFRLNPGSTRLLGNHNCMPPLKDSIGETSSNSSARPSFKNKWNDSSWTSIKEGKVKTSGMRAKEFRPRISAILFLPAPQSEANWDYHFNRRA